MFTPPRQDKTYFYLPLGVQLKRTGIFSYFEFGPNWKGILFSHSIHENRLSFITRAELRFSCIFGHHSIHSDCKTIPDVVNRWHHYVFQRTRLHETNGSPDKVRSLFMKQVGNCEYAIHYYIGYDYRCPETHRVWRHWPSIDKVRWLSQTVERETHASVHKSS